VEQVLIGPGDAKVGPVRRDPMLGVGENAHLFIARSWISIEQVLPSIVYG
jgi:hypothetical protein